MTMTPLHLTLCNGLPYGIKVSKKGVVHNIAHISNKTLALVSRESNGELWKCKLDRLPSNVKPILHRLSDLDKEITHNGERFNPLVKMFSDCCNHPFDNLSVGEALQSRSNREIYNISSGHEVIEKIVIYIPAMRNDYVEWLKKHHFNTENLPDSDFIPVTNEFNPYK